jgi:RNAse (barnase) inhibitor barstar
MKTRNLLLDAALMRTWSTAYDVLCNVFELPSHFGRNLDALYDVLTDKPLRGQRLSIVISARSQLLADENRNAAAQFMSTLTDACADQPRHPWRLTIR